MVYFCIIIRCICGTYLNFSQGRYLRREFESGDSHPNRCRSCDGMGNGISDQCTERYRTDWQEKLDFSDSVGSGNRSFLALLLPCAAAWTGIEGSADR